MPYGIDALEPVISSKALEFHHGKHLKGYVDNLNKLIVGTEFENMPIEEIVLKAPAGPIFNNAGQILNHNLYFTQFKVIGKDGKGGMSLPAPTGNLLSQINRQWGTIDAFKAEFEQKGATLFGSGWVWLQADANGELSIAQYAGADNPVAHVMPGLAATVMPGSTGHLRPILTFDVWEHAYYLDYQNRRAAYLAELWKIVDWEVVEARYTE